MKYLLLSFFLLLFLVACSESAGVFKSGADDAKKEVLLPPQDEPAKPEPTPEPTIEPVPEKPMVYASQKIAIVFEDCWDETCWDARDIKTVIDGQFKMDPDTREIIAINPDPTTLTVVAQKNNGAICEHIFFVEVLGEDGNVKFKDEFPTVKL